MIDYINTHKHKSVGKMPEIRNRIFSTNLNVKITRFQESKWQLLLGISDKISFSVKTFLVENSARLIILLEFEVILNSGFFSFQ